MLNLIFIILIIGIMTSCTNGNTSPVPESTFQELPFQQANLMINTGQTLLKEGDLVVRLNQDPASQYIKNLNRKDKRFSHAGIVFFEKGYPYIYHIINGEENPGGALRKDSLHSYADPKKNYGFGIYRYTINAKEVEKLKKQLHVWSVQGVVFDSLFNLNTDTLMYCSEMIKKGLAKATNNRINIETTKPTDIEAQFFAKHLNLPLSYARELKVVAIDDLYTNANCRMVERFDFGF